MKRLKVGVRRHGPAALPHKNRGRKPKHALPETTRRLIVELAGGPYRNASCPHISELLAQGHDILVSPRTVHRVLAASSLNRARRRPPRRRRTRPRMPQEGLLVQCDASLHQWLEDRAPQCSLLSSCTTSSLVTACRRPFTPTATPSSSLPGATSPPSRTTSPASTRPSPSCPRIPTRPSGPPSPGPTSCAGPQRAAQGLLGLDHLLPGPDTPSAGHGTRQRPRAPAQGHRRRPHPPGRLALCPLRGQALPPDARAPASQAPALAAEARPGP